VLPFEYIVSARWIRDAHPNALKRKVWQRQHLRIRGIGVERAMGVDEEIKEEWLAA
jgi:hypothetical protein